MPSFSMLRKARPSSLRNLLHCLAALWVASSVAHGQSTWRSTLYPANWQPPGDTVSFASAKLIQDFSYAGHSQTFLLNTWIKTRESPTVTNSADHKLYARWNAVPSVNAGPDQALASTLPQAWSPQRIVTPLPDGNLHQITATVPAEPAGRVFVRLSAAVPSSR